MAFDLANHIQGDELERRLLRFVLQNKRDPLLRGSDDLGQWFTTVEQACAHCGVPASQYVDAALLLIHDEDPLLGIMRDRRDIYRGRNGQEYWPWQMFKPDIETVVQVRQGMSAIVGNQPGVLNRRFLLKMHVGELAPKLRWCLYHQRSSSLSSEKVHPLVFGYSSSLS